MNVYADNAATTKICKAASREIFLAMERTFGNPSSLHAEGQDAAAALRGARARIAARLGCQADEIVFTSGGSESDNQALFSAARLGAESGKRHIVTTAFEHHAILHTLEALKAEGFEVTLLDVHGEGIVTPEGVQAALRPDTCLVTVMYANNEIGAIQPISEIGRVCREAGVLFHTDAVQAVGQLPIHVGTQSIDMLSLSAHKFHGPKGTGALYVKKGVPLQSLIHGGAQERGKRAGTENIPAIVGMAAALEESCNRMAETTAHVTELRNRLIDGLSEIPHSRLNGALSPRLPNNVNFSFEGIEGESLVLLLDRMGICASTGSACNSGSMAPSHVLLALGHPPELAHGSLRLTLCGENTESEIDYLISAVRTAVAELRRKSENRALLHFMK